MATCLAERLRPHPHGCQTRKGQYFVEGAPDVGMPLWQYVLAATEVGMPLAQPGANHKNGAMSR
eukprot:977594-Amphidinium_carterae.1